MVGGFDEYGLRDSEDSRNCGGGVEFLDVLNVSRVVSFLRDNSITDAGVDDDDDDGGGNADAADTVDGGGGGGACGGFSIIDVDGDETTTGGGGGGMPDDLGAVGGPTTTDVGAAASDGAETMTELGTAEAACGGCDEWGGTESGGG